MKQQIWTKTLLTIYKFLERVTLSIDKLVEREAENSCFSHSSFFDTYSAFNVSNRLLNYTEKKIALINTKLIVEKALWEIDRESARILIKKFIDKKKNEEIASAMALTNRTFFRKLSKAIEKFSFAVSRFGYSPDKLENMLYSQKWIQKVYDSFTYEQQEEQCRENDHSSNNNLHFLQNVFASSNSLSLFN